MDGESQFEFDKVGCVYRVFAVRVMSAMSAPIHSSYQHGVAGQGTSRTRHSGRRGGCVLCLSLLNTQYSILNRACIYTL